MEKQTTPIGKNYWRGNGIYQTEYDELYDKLVPSSGEAPTVHGELIRGISRLTYDYYNNGNCNVREAIRNYEVVIDPYYMDMIDFMFDELPKQYHVNVEKLLDFITMYNYGYGDYDFSDEDNDYYNRVMDDIMSHVLTTEDIIKYQPRQ